ncbi:MAG: Mut7-C RNAse domain-containing protein [Acidilobaceae archaeon]
MENIKFVVDTMLGDLARWLRIMGYDTVYSDNYNDKQIIEIALLGDRVIITRDKSLYIKARKASAKVILVESIDTREKIAEVAVKAKINISVDPDKSRCPECNGVLEKTNDKNRVKDRVPPQALASYNTFYICTKCSKVYWEGGHWINIRRLIENAKELAKEYKTMYKRRADLLPA